MTTKSCSCLLHPQHPNRQQNIIHATYPHIDPPIMMTAAIPATIIISPPGGSLDMHLVSPPSIISSNPSMHFVHVLVNVMHSSQFRSHSDLPRQANSNTSILNDCPSLRLRCGGSAINQLRITRRSECLRTMYCYL